MNHLLELVVSSTDRRNVSVEVDELISADVAVLVKVDSIHQLLEALFLGGSAIRVLGD